MIVRNVIAADEAVDTVEGSGHLFRTSLISLLMQNLVGWARFGVMYRINSCGPLAPENRGKGLGRCLREFLGECRKEGGASI